jgi:hypothetical protein
MARSSRDRPRNDELGGRGLGGRRALRSVIEVGVKNDEIVVGHRGPDEAGRA